ncbi:KpsF/GutQ family sugar-phosphate isomerase [Poriferisphaera sp. WC338]|uniref:KpsF/GutQ family sugar-phosphate isomerase n=1 Tax=Poriferisphaera sp. WC338 TaxID=3425129 RepID=UPI003D81966A
MSEHCPDSQTDLEFAQQVLKTERDAIGRIQVGGAFVEAVDLILRHTETGGGSLVVSGMGKSGIIGQKLSATFASTGTASHFLHPSEAMHGDLGRVRKGDVVLILSFGGNTDEVASLATVLKQDGVPVIGMVGKSDCDLGRLSTVVLEIGDVTEACPLNLAPTASTTAMLALGDALALAVSRRRDFGVDDFKRVHPAGSLGRQLMPVVQAMRFKAGENLPLVYEDNTVKEAFNHADAFAAEKNLRRTGAILIVDDAGALAGILTDADFRRLMLKDPNHGLDCKLSEVMTRQPRCIAADGIVRDAVQLVRELRIDEVPVVDADGKPVGLIDVQDLIALKVIEG